MVVLCFFCALICVHSSFVIILIGKRELVALFVFLVSHDCCVALPHDATGLSAVCDSGIFLIELTYLLLLIVFDFSLVFYSFYQYS